MKLSALNVKPLPKAPDSVRSLIGPSFILLGLGLGTGEIILWPYLVSNFGLGIIWGAAMGITMQFFLNMEIERYALVNGESAFVGLARIFKYFPFWFIFSTLIAFGWPGFSAASAQIFGQLFPEISTKYLGIAILLIIGMILSLGSVVTKTLERFQKGLILIGFPSILLITVLIANKTDVVTLFKGLAGFGDGFFLIPEGLPLMAFLAAFAYAGAGGNLNLAQSFYIKEKGYGMGKYSGKITSLISGRDKKVRIEGNTFEVNKQNIENYNRWWKLINIEHGLVFWGLGLLTILLLALLSYATVYGMEGNVQGINFLFNEAKVITMYLGNFFGVLFLLITGLMLFATQMTVIDACGRITAENSAIIFKGKTKTTNLSKTYYLFVWVIITIGILIFLKGFTEPQFLITIGAVINAFCMAVYIFFLIILNKKYLHKETQPSNFRVGVLFFTFLFFAIFSALVIYDRLLKPLLN